MTGPTLSTTTRSLCRRSDRLSRRYPGNICIVMFSTTLATWAGTLHLNGCGTRRGDLSERIGSDQLTTETCRLWTAPKSMHYLGTSLIYEGILYLDGVMTTEGMKPPIWSQAPCSALNFSSLWSDSKSAVLDVIDSFAFSGPTATLRDLSLSNSAGNCCIHASDTAFHLRSLGNSFAV